MSTTTQSSLSTDFTLYVELEQLSSKEDDSSSDVKFSLLPAANGFALFVSTQTTLADIKQRIQKRLQSLNLLQLKPSSDAATRQQELAALKARRNDGKDFVIFEEDDHNTISRVFPGRFEGTVAAVLRPTSSIGKHEQTECAEEHRSSTAAVSLTSPETASVDFMEEMESGQSATTKSPEQPAEPSQNRSEDQPEDQTLRSISPTPPFLDLAEIQAAQQQEESESASAAASEAPAVVPVDEDVEMQEEQELPAQELVSSPIVSATSEKSCVSSNSTSGKKRKRNDSGEDDSEHQQQRPQEEAHPETETSCEGNLETVSELSQTRSKKARIDTTSPASPRSEKAPSPSSSSSAQRPTVGKPTSGSRQQQSARTLSKEAEESSDEEESEDEDKEIVESQSVVYVKQFLLSNFDGSLDGPRANRFVKLYNKLNPTEKLQVTAYVQQLKKELDQKHAAEFPDSQGSDDEEEDES